MGQAGVLAILLLARCAEPQADALHDARAALEKADYPAAEQAARQALAARAALAGADPLAVADALDALSEALWRSGKAREPEARASAERALELRESVVGPQDPGVVPSLTNLGSLVWSLGQWDEAGLLYERAYQIELRAHGSDDPRTANALSNVGMVRGVKGDYEQARRMHEDALAVLEAQLEPEHLYIANACEKLGSDYLALGDFPRAREYQERALRIRERLLPPNHPQLAASVGNTAVARYRNGDYAGARPYYRRASELWERIMGPDHPFLAATLSNEAVLLAEMGDLEAARDLFERALAIRERAWGPEHPGLASTLGNLGELSSDGGDAHAAVAYLERALALQRRQGPDYPPTATTLNQLGATYRRTGDLERAERYHHEALDHVERTLGPRSHPAARTLDGLVQVHLQRGKFAEAQHEAERALDIRLASFGEEHPEVGGSLAALARIAWRRGDREMALTRAQRASEILNRFVTDAIASLPERQALLFAASQARPEEILFSGLLSSDDDEEAWLRACWKWSLGRRGGVLDALILRRRFASGELDEQNRDAWEDLRRTRFELASLFVKGPQQDEAKYRAALAQKRAEKERAEARLAERSLSSAREQAAVEPTLEQLERWIPDGAAVVEIVRVEVDAERSGQAVAHDIALVSEAHRAPRFIDLGSSSGVDRLVDDWLASLTPAIDDVEDRQLEQRWRQAGERLREAVWDPIAGRLDAARQVLLVPAGALHHVDFAALPRGEQFLADEDREFHLPSSARQLLRGRPEDRRGRGLLAIGAPDFEVARAKSSTLWSFFAGETAPTAASSFRGDSTPCASMSEQRWLPLPATATEVDDVARRFSGVEDTRVVSGRRATEDSFRRLAPGRRILHLATHGFFLEECGATPAESWRGSPLLLSGLVLAGANRRPEASATAEPGDDGILTAEEVAALDLAGVDLVVLSACDTGRGLVAATEGLVGLRRAFEAAGASRLVMSTWRVPDRAAQRYMRAFYEAYLAGATAHEAVAQATRERLAQEREAGRSVHPFLWAGFVSAGAWDR